jgi:hypothetical protein
MTMWPPVQDPPPTRIGDIDLPPKRRKRWPWIVGSVFVALAAAYPHFLRTTVAPRPTAPPAPTSAATTTTTVTLDAAFQACGSHGQRTTHSDGVTVDLDTSSTAVGTARAAAMGDITCVLTKLGAPTTNPGTHGSYQINWGPCSATWTNTVVGGVEVLIVEHPGATASPAGTAENR